MDVFSRNDVLTGVRFLKTIPSFLRHPWTLSQARQTVRLRLERRASDFCALMKKAVYGNPGSPYLGLLKQAGCPYDELEDSVRKHGLEETLRLLFQEGVYLTVSEFKGRAPVRRGRSTIDAHPSLLRNPLSRDHLRAQTGGSGGRSVPVLIDLAYVRERAADHLLALAARNGRDWVHAVWGIPGNTDMVRVLELCALGTPPERWFTQVDPRSPGIHPRYPWSVRALRWAAWAWGVRVPAPRHASLNDPSAIVQWLRRVLDRGRIPHLVTWASPAVRVCREAERTGSSLSGVQLSIGGEPITAAKMDAIRRTGAAAVPRYMAMECGYIAYGCLQPSFPDELHLFDDMHAAIQPEAHRPESGLPADALLLTSLRPSAPFILLNVSLGDQAQPCTGSCGCPLEQIGWTRRIRQVRSFEKLTAGGMTFLDSDILHVLEEVLPSRLGGSLFDYQLIEEEGASGEPKLRLIISPSVGPVDPVAAKRVFLEAAGRGSGAERLMSLQWGEGDFLSVDRRLPKLTAAGKILHSIKASPGRAAGPEPAARHKNLL